MAMEARQAAVELLGRWRQLAAPPLLPERGGPFWSSLSARDRAFAFDLVQGVTRWRGTLDHLLGLCLDRPLEQLQHPLHAILWLGTFQLLLQDGVADYAAIDTSVVLARRFGHVHAGSLVNAVLRRLQRLRVGPEPLSTPRVDALPLDNQRQLRLGKKVFPDPQNDFAAWAAAAASHPRPLVEAFLDWLSPADIRAVLSADNMRPAVMLRCDAPGWLPPAESGLGAHAQAGYFVAVDGWNETVAGLVGQGLLSPQDPTAGLAGRQLISLCREHSFERREHLRLLDLCAGLGTKTVQIARALPTADITAVDIAAAKLTQLELRRQRLGLTTIQVRPAQEANWDQWRRFFDAALVDAPCSNTGVLARRVQARWRWPLLNRPALRNLQLRLLRQAAAALRPRGILVYSTCSIDPAENQELVARFLGDPTGADWRMVRAITVLPRNSGEVTQRCDGGFVAVLRQEAE